MTTTSTPGAVAWIDLGTTDLAGARSFYSDLFGWTVEDLGPEAGDYGFLRKDGKQVGGIGPATDPARGTSWAVYFATDDVNDTTAKVEAAGGKVIVPPMDVMDQGRMAVFADPAGAFFSAWQGGTHGGAELVAQPGGLAWAELYAEDLAPAKAFYPAVLPVTTRDVPIGEGVTYTLLETGGEAVAGAMQMGPEAGGPRWGIYIEVSDCDATADRAVELGAQELLRDDSAAGRMATLVDPQGGIFSIIKSNPNFSM